MGDMLPILAGISWGYVRQVGRMLTGKSAGAGAARLLLLPAALLLKNSVVLPDNKITPVYAGVLRLLLLLMGLKKKLRAD
jgi:hypothetical protein